MKKLQLHLIILCVCLFSSTSYAQNLIQHPAQNQDIRLGFLEACESSAYVDEEANCSCVYDEIEKTFGKNEAITLIPFVNGIDKLDRVDNDSFGQVLYSCSNTYSSL